MRRKFVWHAVTAGLLLLLLVGAQAQQLGQDKLGTIHFPNSGAPAAQQPFLRGVLLLHSFEYEDARDAFRDAEKADPDFALAYWGEAMTYNHPLWREQDKEAARAALAKLAPTPEARQAKAATAREKGYLHAVEILYGEGSKVERDLAYSEAMGKLADQYRDDLDARAFYALSILGTAEGERDFRIYMRAAAQAEEVFARNPEHPGAIHYLIHSYDDPIHAPLGVRAARVYAKVAPAASHAQHMISHIYVALGAWPEVVDANVKSFAVSEARARRKGLPEYSRNHHALHWLEYALLQQGRYQEARERLETMHKDAAASGTPGNLWYYAAMRAGYVVETRRWDDLPASLGTSGTSLSSAAQDLFASGLAASERGDLAAARQALQQLREKRQAAGPSGSDKTDTYASTSPQALHVAEILELELEAAMLAKEGAGQQAIELARRAVKIEGAMPFEFGPPDVVKPSNEFLGELLLAAGNAAEAQQQFHAALERNPRRAMSLLGLARAASEAGDQQAAQDAYGELGKVWSGADESLPEMQEVRRALQQTAKPAAAGAGR